LSLELRGTSPRRNPPAKLTYEAPPPAVKKKKAKAAPAKTIKKATAGKAKKATAGKAKKEKKGYKQASSAYMFFAKENRDKIKKANKDATFGELGKLLGEAWQKASAKDKTKFEGLAAKDKVRATKDKAAWEKKTKK